MEWKFIPFAVCGHDQCVLQKTEALTFRVVALHHGCKSQKPSTVYMRLLAKEKGADLNRMFQCLYTGHVILTEVERRRLQQFMDAVHREKAVDRADAKIVFGDDDDGTN